jgi:hypothetical protein
MPSYNSSASNAAQSTNGIYDYSGVPVISTGNSFGDSPLGVAARSQAIYGIANAQFNLLPPNSDAELADSENPLPYWSVTNFSDGRIVPKSSFDVSTDTWSVELNPTAGSASDYVELKTRSYLLTDDNLALRQKAYLTTSKGTAYAGTTQFNMVLSAEYFSVDGTSLSSYAIGTALDNGTFTSISGITTSGSAAISASAAYVDFTIKLTCTATVTSGVKVYLKSFFIQTSQAATGNFLITETFASSGSFLVPTGVDYVTVVAVSGGQGGGGGANSIGRATSTQAANGGAGGATGYYALVRDIYVGDVGTVSVGIGAGGSGGTAFAFSKAAGATTTSDNGATTGANGGDTTFGTYLTVAGARTAPTGFFGLASAAGASGGATGIPGAVGGTHAVASGNVGAPFTPFYAGGVAGVTATGSGGTGASGAGGAAGTALGFAGGGGGGGRGTANATGLAVAAGAGGVGGPGGGASGGGAAARYGTATVTIVATAGAGASAAANSGAGGGGGGGCAVSFSGTATYVPSTLTTTSGAGGAGGSGKLLVIYAG